MGLNLTKGGNLNLTKTAPGLTHIIVGLGWDVRKTTGVDFDLDASAFLLNKDGKVRGEADCIYYNNKTSTDGSVVHQGDNRTGAGEGDDEQIKIDLSKVPADIHKIALVVTIDDADTRRQNFGQVEKATIRVVNGADNVELTKFDLSEDASTVTAMVLGELYRADADWKFKAVGQGSDGGLGKLAANYGIV